MSNLKRKMHLQLFAQGGTGGAAPAAGADAGGNAAAGVNGTVDSDADADVPSFIPEKAKAIYRSAMKKHRAAGSAPAAPAVGAPQPEAGDAADTAEPNPQPEEQAHIPFAELIKSPAYKDEFKQYMNEAFQKRFKNQNARNARVDEILSTVATKYGLDPRSDTFLDDLKKATDEDDAYFEAYAAEHDMTKEEARRVALLERQLANANREAEERRVAEENAERIRVLRARAAETQRLYPSFDLDTEMKNPAFVRLVAATQGDTTAAYKAVHHDEIVNHAVQKATADAARATVNNIRGGSARPAENGVSASAPPAREEVDYSGMNLQQLRAQAAYWRRHGG